MTKSDSTPDTECHAVKPFPHAVAVIIVNFNSGERLGKCLTHLEAQSIKGIEVIVVDNASTDHSCDAISRSSLAIRLIRSPDNIGFAAANNLAAKYAQSEWLAFLNPDAYPDPDWIEMLLAAASKYPWADAFGSTQIDAGDPTRIDGAGDVFHIFGIPYRGHHGWPIESLPPDGECFAPCAAAAMYRSATFSKLGGFDERFFCYAEDVDLGFRLRLAGGKAMQVQSARVLHEGSGITGRASDFTIYHGNRNRIWATYKNMPSVIFWPFFPVHLAVNLYLLARAFSVGVGKAYWCGLKDGFSGLSNFRADRLRIQADRSVPIRDLAAMLAWSPFNVTRRKAVLKMIHDDECPK